MASEARKPNHQHGQTVGATRGGLFASTIIAALIALAILVLFWLPAEYGYDPTGIGKKLGLTSMGEFKEARRHQSDDDDQAGTVIESSTATIISSNGLWKDEVELDIPANTGLEAKLVMDEGAIAAYEWTANGATVYHDTHGENETQEISYNKGRGIAEDTGTLTAAFDGKHGWYWENRTQVKVTITLRTKGDYKRMLVP